MISDVVCHRIIGLAATLIFVLSCEREHDPAAIEVASNDCITCHTPEYLETATPIHKGAFPETCFECHTNTAWSPSIFEHGNAVSPCLACHTFDYDGTSDPTHRGLFPTTCDQCHGTQAWRPALEGEHPDNKFEISGGPHQGYECLQCHNPDLGVSTGGVNADCVGCHEGEHSQAKMADKHKEENDYNFDPANPGFCLECHPTGKD